MSNSNFSIKDWPELLERIRHRPAIYLGQASLTALHHLIGGIGFAEDIYDIPREKRLAGFAWDEFEEWIRKRFNPQRLSVRSFWLALHSTTSEKEALKNGSNGTMSSGKTDDGSPLNHQPT